MMDIVLSLIPVIIELVLLVAIFYHILNGVRLILFDIGLTAKYSKIMVLTFSAVMSMIVVFLISHLLAFYPTM